MHLLPVSLLEERVPGLPRNTRWSLGGCRGRVASCCKGCHLCVMEMRWVSFCGHPFGHEPWVTLCSYFQPSSTSASSFIHTSSLLSGSGGGVGRCFAFLCIWSQKRLWELQASNKASSKFCSTTFILLRKYSRACRIFVWLILAVDRKQTFRLKTFTSLCIDNTNMYLASAWEMHCSACVYPLSRLLQQTWAEGLTKSTHTTQNYGDFTLSWKTEK